MSCLIHYRFILISWSCGRTVSRAPANKQQASADAFPPTVVVSGDGDRLALAGALEILTLAAVKSSLANGRRKERRARLILPSLTAWTHRVRCFCAVFVTRVWNSPASAPNTRRCSISSAK